jgi:hypothetical protein
MMRVAILFFACAIFLGIAGGPASSQTLPGAPTALCNNSTTSSSSTLSCTMNHASVTNEKIIVSCGAFGYSTAPTITVTDNASGGSNTYTQDAQATNTGGPERVATFSADVVRGGGSTLTVTCHYSPASIDVDMLSAEFANLATGAKDSSTTAIPTGLAPNTLNQIATNTSTARNTLAYSACNPHKGLSPQAGPGWTALQQTSVDEVTDQYRVYLESGSQVVAFLEGNNTTNDDLACTFAAYALADQTAVAGVAVGNSSASLQFGAGSGSTTWSWTDTVSSSGSNTLAIVDLFINGTTPPSAAPTYGGTSMTLITNITDQTNLESHYVYKLVNPPAGANTVSVSFGSAKTGAGISTNFFNVNQSSPTSAAQTDNGSTLNPANLTVSSAANHLVYTSVGIADKSACPASGVVVDTNNLNVGQIPTAVIGHVAGASSVTAGWNLLTTNGIPSCPGTNGTGIERTHIAFDIASASGVIPSPVRHRAIVY